MSHMVVMKTENWLHYVVDITLEQLVTFVVPPGSILKC